MKKNLIFCLLLTSIIPLRAAQNSDLILHIKNLDSALADIDQLANTLKLPIPTQMIPMQLGQLMMSPNLESIDTTKPITLFLTQQKEQAFAPPRIVTLFSLKGDGTQHLESVKNILPHYEKKSDTIHHFPMEGTSFYVIMKNGQAMSGHHLQDIKSMGRDLTSDTKELLNSMSGNISLSISTDTLHETLKQQLDAQTAALKSMPTQDSPHTMNPADVLESYNNMALQALLQLDQLIINLDLDQQITLRTHIKGKPESTLQKIIAQSTPTTGPASNMLSEHAIINAYGSLADIDDLITPLANFLAESYKKMGPPLDKMADPYKEMILSTKGLYNGKYSLTWLPPTDSHPLRFTGMYGINNKAQAQTAMKKIIDQQKTLFDAIENSPINFTIQTQTLPPYNDTDIEQLNISYSTTNNIPGIPQEAFNILSNLTYYIAYSDSAMYYSMGEPKALHNLIDHFATTNNTPPLRPGLEDIQQPLDDYWNLDLGAYISLVTSFVPKETPGMDNSIMEQLKNIHAGLRGGSYTEHNGLTTLLRITLNDIKNLKEKLETMRPTPATP